MAVRCSKCGEELLGPVNRCWKCGQAFAALPEAGGLPPVRREAIPVAAAPVPAVASAPASAMVPAVAASDEATPAATLAPPAASSAPPVRTGSPFAPAPLMTAPAAIVLTAGAPGGQRRFASPSVNRSEHIAVAGAVAAIFLGVFALLIAWISNPVAAAGAAMIAILGLIMGIWGLYSRRRGWALFGMIVCVIAISVSAFTGAMLVFEAQRAAEERMPEFAEDSY